MSFATTFADQAAAVLPRPLRRRRRQVRRRAGGQVAAHRLLPTQRLEPDPRHPQRGQPGGRAARAGARVRHRLLRRRRRRHLALGVPRAHRAVGHRARRRRGSCKEPENQMVRGLAGATLSVTGAPSGMNFREAATPAAHHPDVQASDHRHRRARVRARRRASPSSTSSSSVGTASMPTAGRSSA